jgi:CDP-glucose 4,6-dehydratase
MLGDGHGYAEPWNFGPTGQDGDRPVRWVVDRFLAEWGSGSWTTPTDAGPEPPEAHRLSLDSSKARERLGWAPVWDSQTAVRQTAAWYRAFYASPTAARDLVDDQLRTYQDDARMAGLPWTGAGA